MRERPTRSSSRWALAFTALVTLALVAPGLAVADGRWSDRTRAVRAAIDGGSARNVILLIGDGMGDSEITLARNYLVGAGGKLNIDRFPLTGQMTTYSVREVDPSAPDYTPESGATATGWSTGHKTSDGRISTSPGTDRDLPTILELAERAGYRTGNVTTAELTDATPAAPMSHVRLRTCQGPADMADCPQDLQSAGGPGSIAEQSINKGIDVLLGGGRQRYEQTITEGPDAGQTVLEAAEGNGYDVVSDRAGLLGAGRGQPLLGLFTSGDMSVEFGGEPAANPASGPQRCNENQRPANQPSLAEMTGKAIQLLQQRNGRRGFFLQVESASIDKRAHASKPCEQIGETKNLDEATRVALDFAHHNPDTLVLITGDHAQTGQIVEVGATVPGFASILVTDEGQRIQVSYGTGTGTTTQGHTGSQIRVAGRGPQAANVVGLIDQTDLFSIMARALRVR